MAAATPELKARFKEDDGKWRKVVQYKPTRWHGKYGGGGYTNQFEYDQSLEKFNDVWEQFMLGYKEYQQLKQENSVNRDFGE